MSESEQPMIRGCMEGKRSSQQELYTRYAPKMAAICARYAKNKAESDEIMQEGFYRIFRNIHQFKFSGSFEGWIRRIIVNTAIQYFKKESKLYAVVQLEPEQNHIPDTRDFYSRLEEKKMLELVQRLPTGYRMVFNLFVFEGFKHREIALILGISEGTSKSNLFDARKILKKALILENSYPLKKVR